MKYLLDTNVVSEMRRAVVLKAHPGVQRWLDVASAEALYLSAITIVELQTGILLKMQKDRVQARIYERWLYEQVIPNFAGRIVPVDLDVALRCGKLHVPKTSPYLDALIAATALVHELTVVTRNVKHFVPMGVAVLNPWDAPLVAS